MMKALALAVLLMLLGMMAAITTQTGSQAAVAQAAPVQGCPACHGAAGKEPALDAVAAKVKNHPPTAAKAVAQCALCHRAGPQPPPLRTLLHRKHLSSSKFTTTYKGTCTSCHNVDKATGTVTVFGLER